MLRLNYAIPMDITRVVCNLNTSYVEVKLSNLVSTFVSVLYLNTSYVEVKLKILWK